MDPVTISAIIGGIASIGKMVMSAGSGQKSINTITAGVADDVQKYQAYYAYQEEIDAQEKQELITNSIIGLGIIGGLGFSVYWFLIR